MGRKARAANANLPFMAAPEAARVAGLPMGGPAAVPVGHDGMLQHALAIHKSGDYEAAAEAYRLVLRRFPRSSDAHNLYGVLCHQLGRHDEAIAELESAIKLDKSSVPALVNLGATLTNLGRFDQAAPYLERALKRLPSSEEALANLGDVRANQGRPGEAYAHYEAASRLNPTVSKYYRGMAMARLGQGRLSDAVDRLRHGLEVNPGRWDLRLNLAEMLMHVRENAEAKEIILELLDEMPPGLDRTKVAQSLARLGRMDEAELCLREELKEHPDKWQAKLSLARVLMETGRIDEGKALFDEVAEERPTDSLVWNDLGAVYSVLGRHVDAVAAYKKGLEIEPDSTAILTNLGVSYINLTRFQDGFETFRRVTQIDPEQVAAQVSQCQALQRMKRLDEALVYAHGLRTLKCYDPKYFNSRFVQVINEACDFDTLIELDDIWDTAQQFSRNDLSMSMLTLLSLADDLDKQRKLVGLAQRLGEADARRAEAAPLQPRPSRARTEKLRIGFVSSDFRNHSVTKCVLPLFHYYDRDRFEVHCYSSWPGASDAQQALVAGKVDSFSPIHSIGDREAAEKIRDDNIDILIDLNGWTGMSRLAMFCYRPAPVQATWLGWPLTTGLSSIDYFLMDSLTRPTVDGLLLEKPLELEGSWVCFAGFDDVEVGPSPFERNGHLTFGTLNNVYKFTRRMIARWSEVLREFEDARFIIVRPESRSLLLRKNIMEEFARNGVDPGRLEFMDNTRGTDSHLAYYNLFDLSLDTYPATGGNTTLDALWMGMPVVGLNGPAFNNRICYAILNHCGVGELCAETEDEYVQIALDLARDRGRIAEYRRTLRDRMASSPLCQGQPFAERFGAAMTRVGKEHGLI